MTRIHDMGGRFGDGPIPLKKIDGKVVDDEPVFKTDWHAKALLYSGICFSWKVEYR